MMKKNILIGMTLLFLVSCAKEKKLKEEIYDEPGYAIGKVTASMTAVMVQTHHYEYQVAGVVYKGKKKGGITNSSDSRWVGRYFLVVFKKSEPEKSDLNFKYPINSEQEFIDLVAGFVDNPPKP